MPPLRSIAPYGRLISSWHSCRAPSAETGRSAHCTLSSQWVPVHSRFDGIIANEPIVLDCINMSLWGQAMNAKESALWSAFLQSDDSIKAVAYSASQHLDGQLWGLIGERDTFGQSLNSADLDDYALEFWSRSDELTLSLAIATIRQLLVPPGCNNAEHLRL